MALIQPAVTYVSSYHLPSTEQIMMVPDPHPLVGGSAGSAMDGYRLPAWPCMTLPSPLAGGTKGGAFTIALRPDTSRAIRTIGQMSLRNVRMVSPKVNDTVSRRMRSKYESRAASVSSSSLSNKNKDDEE